MSDLSPDPNPEVFAPHASFREVDTFAPHTPDILDELVAQQDAEPASNSAEMSALFDELVPQDVQEEVKDELDEPTMKHISALAQDPKLGEEFWFGGKKFNRQFISIEAEQNLIEMIRVALANAPKGNMLLGFMNQLPVTKQATILILSDYDPTIDMDWLTSRPKNDRGAAVTTQRMIALIVAQMKLNEITGFLAELLALAGFANQFAGAKVPG